MKFRDRISEAAARLSDEALIRELRCAEHCALCSTRCRRDLALLRFRCLRDEFQRRAAIRSGTLTLIR